jgi:hypothetical protein
MNLLTAKINLYSLLINKGVDNLSKEEINIMYELCQDKEIQEFLNETKE